METTTVFTDFGLQDDLVNALQNIGFENASPVQELTIKPILEGKDIFAQAETGSGKTGSFAIPIIEQILRHRSENENSEDADLAGYVVLSPTRELAQQTHKTFNDIGKNLGINSTCLIGGENIENQKSLLKKLPQVLVATPGRLCDLVKQKCVDLSQCQSVVFDEADRLFDMGFKKEIEFILNKIPTHRQLVMVSATSNMDVLNTAYKFKSDPLELKLNEDNLLVENIDHKIAMVSREEKMPLLTSLLRNHEDTYALVFCNTQVQTHLVAEWLKAMGFKSMPISGAMPQNKRTKLMADFREKKVTILVCTDVAARGLDIKDVNLVVNYDLPQEAASYVHRIGRTGRAGKSGQAISFCAFEDSEFLDPIMELIGEKIPKMDLSDEDFAKDLAPKPYLDFKTLRVVERKNDRNNDRNKDRKNKRTDDKRPEAKASDAPKQKKETAPAPKREPLQLFPFVPSQSKGKDKRVFIYNTSDEEKLKFAALGHFGILDGELLEKEVIKQGRPKYFFFGPRVHTYKVTLKPIYKKLLTPFLEEILNHSRLNLEVRVSFKHNTLTVHYTGEDQGLVLCNRKELLNSFEQLTKVYLAQKIRFPKDLEMNFICGDQKERERNPKRARSGQNGRGNSERKGSRSKREGPSDKELIKMANGVKDQVINNKKPVRLKPLNSPQRRIVHQHLSEDERINTSSIGEGRFKEIEVSLR